MFMSKHKSTNYQVKGILSKLVRFGVSRKDVKREFGGKSPFIHSFDSYKTYTRLAMAFAKWAKETHGERDVTKMRCYVREYLEYITAKNLSVFTIRTHAQALAKLYGCSSTDFGFAFVPRTRAVIKRSRGEVKGFNEERYGYITDFIDATGLRRHEVLGLRRREIYYCDGVLYVFVRQGKGGRQREVPVLRSDEKTVLNIKDRALGDDEKLFKKSDIPKNAPCHAHRAKFAAIRYGLCARPIEEVPKKERYYCRKDQRGTVMDRLAMKQVSGLLGHNRIDVIAQSYAYMIWEKKKTAEGANAPLAVGE